MNRPGIADALTRRVQEAQDRILSSGTENVGSADLILGVMGWQGEMTRQAVADGIKAGFAQQRRAGGWRERTKAGGPWSGVGAGLMGAVWALREWLGR